MTKGHRADTAESSSSKKHFVASGRQKDASMRNRHLDASSFLAKRQASVSVSERMHFRSSQQVGAGKAGQPLREGKDRGNVASYSVGSVG
jgi:hypothetical protein